MKSVLQLVLLLCLVGSLSAQCPPALTITITSQPSALSQTVCQGGAVTSLSISATGPSLVYQWYINSVNSNTGGLPILGAMSSTYAPPTLGSGAYYYYAVVSNWCSSITSSVSGLITINPSTTITSESTPPFQIVCQNGITTPLSVTATGTGTLYYQWESFTPPQELFFSPVIGANNSSYTPSSAIVGRVIYRVQVAGNCGSVTSNEFVVITETAQPVTFNTQPSTAGQSVCQNGTSTPITVSATGVTTSYNWYQNTINSNTGGAFVTTGANSFSPPTQAIGANYYYVIASNSCGSATSQVSGLVTVNASATTITSQLPSTPQTVCQNGVVAPLTVVATGTSLTYQWQELNINVLPPTPTLIPGATSPTFTPSTSTPGVRYYSLVVSGAGLCGTQTSNIFRVIVNPNTISSQPSPLGQTVCQNGTVTPLTIGAAGASSIQWYRNAVNSNIGGTMISGANSSQYTPPSTTIGANYYYAVVIGSCGAETSMVSGLINVVPTTTILSQPSTNGETICQNGAVTPLTVIASGDNLSYQWEEDFFPFPGGGLPPISGANSSTYTPSSATAGNMYYRVVVSGTCGNVTSEFSGAITINPPPIIYTQPSITSQTYCQNTPLPSVTTLTINSSGISYQWYSNSINSNVGGSIIPGATNYYYTPSTATMGANYYYAVVSGDCGTVNSQVSGLITVNPITAIVSHPATTGQVLCQNGLASPLSVGVTGASLNYQWQSSSSAGGPFAMETGANNSTYTPPTSTVGTRYYRVLVSGICGGLFSNVSGAITVNQATVINTQPSATNQTVCQNGALTSLTISAIGTGIAYQWYSNNVNSNTGGTSISLANSNTLALSSTTPMANYYYVVVAGVCGTVTSSVSGLITVNPVTVITTQPSNSAQTVCQNSVATPLTVVSTGASLSYQWSSSINSGGPFSAIGGANGTSFTPPSASVGTTYYRVTITGACGTAVSTTSGAITVNLATVINTQPSTTPQTVCQNAAVTPLSVSAVGSGISYQWFWNATNSNTGGTSIGGANSSTYTPSIIGTTYYYVTVSGGCGVLTSNTSGAITLQAATIINTQPLSSPQSICLNGVSTFCPASPTTLTVAATGNGTLSYQWFSNSTSSNSGGIAVGTNSSSYTPPATVVGIQYYYVVVGGSCNSVTSIVAGPIMVNASTVITTQPSTTGQTVCQNVSASALTVAATGTGPSAYQWYSNTVNSNSGGTAISGASNASYVPTTATLGTRYYYATATGLCGVATSNPSGAIVVNSMPTTITAQPSSTSLTVCRNNAFGSLSVTATGMGTLSYQWFQNLAPSNSGGTPVGTNSSIYTPSSATVGTLYYYVVVTAGCGSVTSNISGARTVTALSAITTHPITSVQSVCQGGAFTALTVAATGTGTVNYQWYQNTVANNSSGTAIGSATSSSYTPSSASVGTLYYYAIASSNCGSAVSNVSGARTVTALSAITTHPSTSAQSVCQGGAFTALTVAATGTGTVSYQWYQNTVASNSGGTVVGTNSTSYTPSSATVGTLYYYAVASSSCGSATSNVSGDRTVTTPSAITTHPSATTQSVCQGGAFTALTVAATGTGTVNYQWYQNTVASNSGGTAVGANSSSYTPSSALAGTLYYYAVASSGCGSATSNVSGGISVTALSAITTHPSTSAQTVCQGGAFTALSVAATGTVSYQWYQNTVASNSGGTAVGTNSSSYTPSSASLGTLYYYAIASSSCGSVTSNVSGAITVNATTIITTQPSSTSQQVCQNRVMTPFTVVATGNGTLSYQWYSNTTNANTGGTAVGTNSSSYTPLSTTVGTRYYYVIINGGCGVVTSSVSGAVVVNSPFTINSFSGTSGVCPGNSYSYSVSVSPGGSYTYQWSAPSGWSGGGSGSSVSYSLSSNPSYGAVQVIVSNGICTGSTGLTVYPTSCGSAARVSSSATKKADAPILLNEEVTEPTVFPNPSSSEMTLALPYVTEVDLPIRVYSLSGLLFSSTIQKGTSQKILNTSNLPSGLYNVHFETKSGLVVKKVLVAH